MAPPFNPATARVVLTVTRDTRKYLNIIHMARADGSTLDTADLTNMANVVADWWQNSYRQSCLPVMVGESVTATKQDPSDPQQVTVYINGPGAYNTGAALPGNSSVAVSWRTGLAGRKYRGRTYHFGIADVLTNTADQLTGSGVSNLSAVASYLLNHVATAVLQQIIFHRDTNTFTPIVTSVVDNLLDSQRRRLAARGE